jgi:hypothetical protein
MNKKIEGYNYEVSDYGEVYSLQYGRPLILKQSEHKGYRRICLSKGNKRKQIGVHVLVARAFIPNPDNKPFVNHKDGNKRNNKVENLEWCSREENQKHSRDVLGNTNLGNRNGNHGYRKSKFYPSEALRSRLIELGVSRNKHDIVSLGEMLKEYKKDGLYAGLNACSIYGDWKKTEHGKSRDYIYNDKNYKSTEAEARAKMLIYLLENNLINNKQGNER